MRARFTLNQNTYSLPVQLNFSAQVLSVFNPTPYPLYIRTGALDIPNKDNADYIVFAGKGLNLNVTGVYFALYLDFENNGLINTGICQVIFIADEIPATYSDIKYNLVNTIYGKFLPLPAISILKTNINVSGAGGIMLSVSEGGGSTPVITFYDVINGQRINSKKYYLYSGYQDRIYSFPVCAEFVEIDMGQIGQDTYINYVLTEVYTPIPHAVRMVNYQTNTSNMNIGQNDLIGSFTFTGKLKHLSVYFTETDISQSLLLKFYIYVDGYINITLMDGNIWIWRDANGVWNEAINWLVDARGLRFGFSIPVDIDVDHELQIYLKNSSTQIINSVRVTVDYQENF